MRLIHVTTLMAALVVTPGCSKDGKSEKSPEDAASSAVKEVEDVLAQAQAAVKDGKALTQAQYEKLMLQLTTCDVKDTGIDYKCEANKTLNKASNLKTNLKNWSGMMSSLGKKHLGHEHPAVRLKSANLLNSFFGSKPETQKLVLSAIAKEKHPAVTVALMSVVASKASKNPAVAKMLFDKTGAKSPVVRKKAISGLASSWAKGVDGRIDKLIDMMKNDKDMGVRGSACRQAGGTGDKKLIAVYEELTTRKVDKKLYAECMAGLVDTWLDFPFYETLSAEGYALTMKRLKKTPRDDAHPPWSIMSSFGHLADKKSNNLKKWKANAKFYKKKEVVKVLKDIVKDENANWMGRTGAVRSLAKLMKKDDFEKLSKKCAECNTFVVKELKKELAKM